MADVLVWCVAVGAALVAGWKASQSAHTIPTASVPARSTAWLDDDPFIGGDGRAWLPQPDGTWAPPP